MMKHIWDIAKNKIRTKTIFSFFVSILLCLFSLNVQAAVNPPDYYAADDLKKLDNGTYTVKNYHKYVQNDKQYLADLMQGDGSPEEIAQMIMTYSTLATSMYEYRPLVEKELKSRKKKGLLNEQQYKNAVNKMSNSFNKAAELEILASRVNMATQDDKDKYDKGEIEIKDPRYAAVENQINRDLKNGLITEKEAAEQLKNLQNAKDNRLVGVAIRTGDNSVCKVAEMEKKYQSSCYSCIVVKTLLEKFINACTKVSDLCRRAAVQVLLVATLLWVAFWALKTISSVASLEPSSIVNTLLIQGFKILFAYVVIESGIEVFMIYVVSPILVAGADFGTAILANSQSHLSMTPSPDYTYSGVELLSADMLNKIMGFNESLDRVVSTNLVIGHALTCHSVNAGAWVNHSIMDFQIIVPNVWIWLCGAAIWFAGFMLVLAVSYYLLDISFKIGIAIMIFPLLMALWPFSITAGKVKTCIKTMLSSAAIFAFLAITTSYAMAMISVTLRDVPELFERVEKGDSKWISDTFDITGPYFILILFAYLYSIKLVRSTVDDYVNKFFGGGLMANASPMHSEMTRMTDIAKKATVGAGKAAVGAATGGAGKVLGAVAGATVGKAAKFVKDKFTKSDKEQGKNNKSPNAGTAVKQSGKAIKQSGKAVEQSGKAVEQAGKGVDKAGQGIAHGGKGIMTAGKGLSAPGVGAIIGVPMRIVGAAVYAGGAAVQAGGKATVAAGKAVKASGKVMKKSGEMIEKAGRSMEKFGRKLKFGKDADKQDKPQDNQENSGQAE